MKAAAGQTAGQLVLNTSTGTTEARFNEVNDLELKKYSDSTRPSPGTAGRVIFNTTDGNLNIDNGTNWILPDGTVT